MMSNKQTFGMKLILFSRILGIALIVPILGQVSKRLNPLLCQGKNVEKSNSKEKGNDIGNVCGWWNISLPATLIIYSPGLCPSTFFVNAERNMGGRKINKHEK